MEKQLIERIDALEQAVSVMQRQMALAMEHRIATMPIGPAPLNTYHPPSIIEWPTLDPYKVTCSNGDVK